jgi:16S rRNA (uracil1498-N3)-methyltransferase
VATAAAEQSGRTQVPRIEPVCSLAGWLESLGSSTSDRRAVLSLADDASALAASSMADDSEPWVLLSGPEGGLDGQEEAAARDAGFAPVSLGPRVLRADTAPLAALALLVAFTKEPR